MICDLKPKAEAKTLDSCFRRNDFGGGIASLTLAMTARGAGIASLTLAMTARGGGIASLTLAMTARGGGIASLTLAMTNGKQR